MKGLNHEPECRVFSKTLSTNFKFKVRFDRGENHPCPEYDCIAPLRGLELKHNNAKLWNRLLLLMDHDQDNNSNTEFDKIAQVNVVDFLTKICGLDYQPEEIHRILGIIKTNALKVQDPKMKMKGISGRVVYPTLSYISHSCLCNAKYRLVLHVIQLLS